MLLNFNGIFKVEFCFDMDNDWHNVKAVRPIGLYVGAHLGL